MPEDQSFQSAGAFVFLLFLIVMLIVIVYWYKTGTIPPVLQDILQLLHVAFRVIGSAKGI